MSTPTILIADDSLGARNAIEVLLLPENYNLVFAENGSTALELAAQLTPDAILCDVMMPDMNGFEVCRRVRADSRLSEIPIILVTALDDRQSKLQGLEAGADDFFSKPFDPAELRARLRTITRLNRFRKLNEERLKQSQANHALEEAYDATIAGWARALDLREHETAGHSQRVVDLTARLAQKLGVPESELVHIRRGALLHDIGKIGVPDTILLKPSTLSDDEWIIMRQHPVTAYELLHEIAYLHPAIDIPYCHHEKWNGTGYPRGLKGEEIPLAARIFAVVDVWDALTSVRPYRLAWDVASTFNYIHAQSGKYFDPAIVEEFLKMVAT